LEKKKKGRKTNERWGKKAGAPPCREQEPNGGKRAENWKWKKGANVLGPWGY